MNTLRGRLVERARAGDNEAWGCLLDALPATLPARVADRFRDAEIRAIAAWLRDIGLSNWRISRLLESAGDAILTRRGLPTLPQISTILDREEQIVLRHRLEPLLGTERSWPRERRMRTILAEGSGNSTPVETARDAA